MRDPGDDSAVLPLASLCEAEQYFMCDVTPLRSCGRLFCCCSQAEEKQRFTVAFGVGSQNFAARAAERVSLEEHIDQAS